MKIAVVHDWLVVEGGAEQVLRQILELFPEADVFTTVYFPPPGQLEFLQRRRVTTSFIQRLPFARTRYRGYLPLMPLAVEQLDFSAYDLIISSSYAVAKGVITGPDQLHVSYVHSPMRYAWDLQHQYLRESKLERGVKSMLARYLLHHMRLWDTRTANGVDHFVANSAFIARRIMKTYRRHAEVIHPPVALDRFTPGKEHGDYYLTASRLVPYKRIPLIVEAFAGMPDKKLVVIGDGPEMPQVRKLAGPNVTLLGYQPNAKVVELMQGARAFVFAAEEDFGIVPVEAQACGTPVIAYGRGGALETVRGQGVPNPTGVFFDEQSPQAIQAAVRRFETSAPIPWEDCRANALRFATPLFQERFRSLIDRAWSEFRAARDIPQGAGNEPATAPVPAGPDARVRPVETVL